MDLSVIAILFSCVVAGASLWFFVKSGSSDSTGLPGTKPIGWLSLAGYFLAYQIGGSSILYTVECAQSDGIYAILYPLGSALGLLALGLGLGSRIAKLQISSVPDLFEKHYRSETLKKVSCFLSMASILGWPSAQAIALRELFRFLGLQQDIPFIVAWAAIVFFTVRGKLKTKGWITLMQAAVLLVFLSAACFFSPKSPTSSISLMGSFSGIETEFIEGFNSKLSAYLLMPCLFMFLEPEMVKSSLRVRSKRDISVAVLFSGIVLLLCSLIPVYLGIAGKINGSEESSTSEFMSTVGAGTNPIITICSACILLVALVSAASTLISSLNTHLLKDLSQNNSNIILKFSWGWTLLLGMMALAFSYTDLTIGALILQSYELAVVCMFIPLVQAACARGDSDFPKLAAGLSMFFGAMGFCLCRVYEISFFPEVFSITLSWIGYMLGKWLSKPIEGKQNGQNVNSEGLRCS
jgi:SSS family solute:Na+ symporter